jgi:hypothetical protein
MDGYSLVDVIRIVEKTERTNADAVNLSEYFELSSRSVGTMNLPVVYIRFLVACTNWKDVCDGIALVHDKENLALKIYFHMSVAGMSRKRFTSYPKCFKFLACQLSGSFAAFDLLKSN